MELSRFLKQNIKEFLDEKSSQRREELNQVREEEVGIFSVEKDYAKLTAQALNNHDLVKAKSIFDELRSTYNGLGKDDDKRVKIYAILEEVYTKIKAYVAAEEETKSLAEELEEFHSAKDKSDPDFSVALSAEQKKAEEEKKLFEISAQKALEQRKKLDSLLQEKLDAVMKAVREENVENAVDLYRDAKSVFSQYPAGDKFRKIEWYKQIIGTYEQVRSLKETITAKRAASFENAPLPPKELTKNVDSKSVLVEIKTIIKSIIAHVDKGQIHEAESLIIDAKHRISLLDENKNKYQKEALDGMINSIVHRIQFLKHQNNFRNTDSVAKHLEVLYKKALVEEQNGNVQEAIGIFRKILEIMPNHFQAQIRLKKLLIGDKHNGINR